jgi:hypothetical protein
MLKASGTTENGEPLLLIGLSEGNMQKLLAGEPIHFALKDVGLGAGSVMILGGKTELDIAQQLGVPVTQVPTH